MHGNAELYYGARPAILSTVERAAKSGIGIVAMKTQAAGTMEGNGFSAVQNKVRSWHGSGSP